MTTAFRAAVMLAVLVGLPAAWVYYGPLPPGAQRVVDRFVAAAKNATGWSDSAQPGGPASRPVAGAPSWAPPQVAERSLTVPFGTDVPQAPELIAPNPAPVDVAPPPAENPAGSTLAAQLDPLLQTLRQHGALEYSLDRWGTSGNLYRFRCTMPVAAAQGPAQEFETVAESPQAAIEQVAAEVTSWQAARQTALR